MSEPVHPSLDVLADHHEGLLSGDPATQTEAHLATCSQCRDRLAELDDVAAVLAEEGRAPITMPVAVSASLEEAIGRAAAERATGQVVSMQEHRGSPHDERSLTRRAWPLLAAAAAVVVVSSIGVNLVQDGSGSDNAATGSSADTAERYEPGAAAGNGDGSPGDVSSVSPGNPERTLATLDTASVLRYADLLDDGTVKPVPVPSECAGLTAPAVGAARTRSLVTYGDQRAVLSVATSARRVTVYACDTADKVLYRHGY